jgi:hypothetical protein
MGGGKLDTLDCLLKARMPRRKKAEGTASPMMAESPPKLRITRRCNATPERVFDAWIDPCPYAFSSLAQRPSAHQLHPGGYAGVRGTREGFKKTGGDGT